jgi:hypothetical protein
VKQQGGHRPSHTWLVIATGSLALAPAPEIHHPDGYQ